MRLMVRAVSGRDKAAGAKRPRPPAIEELAKLGIAASADGRNWVRLIEGPAGKAWGASAPQARLRQQGGELPPSIDPSRVEEAQRVLDWFEVELGAQAALEMAGGAYRAWLRKGREEAGGDEASQASLDAKLREQMRAGHEVSGLEDALAEARAQWSASWRVERQAEELEESLSLRTYPQMFPLARSMGRAVEIFAGPTNSGKTYAALDILSKAGTGAYLAPLRLLALEGQEALSSLGRTCSLVTGEERRLEEGASLVSSTVEMADFSCEQDVVVIDEAQMLADPDRGWAWTAAICGAPAKRLVVVCAPEAVAMVGALLARCGESPEIRMFQRKTPLEAQERPVSVRDIAAGDALIAFSRKTALAWRDKAVSMGRSAAVIYGALSPEARRAEARRFREGEAEVLVATDAIGMGLNLPIQRVVFTTCSKFDGEKTRQLAPQEIRQIAGRAGRFGMSERGRAAAMDEEGARLVAKALGMDPPALEAFAIVAPNERQVQTMAQRMEVDKLAVVLRFFRDRLVKADPLFKAAKMEDMIELALRTDRRSDLDLLRRFAYAKTPLDKDDVDHVRAWESWMATHARGRAVRAPLEPARPRGPSEADQLWEWERASRLLSAYCWLSWRFEEAYPDRDKAEAARNELSNKIENALARMGSAKSGRGPRAPDSSRRKNKGFVRGRGR